MRHFNNLHKDEFAVVIGNGPSLNAVPDSFLRKYLTFGSNRIYLKFVPSYYVAINPLVIEQNKRDIKQLPCPKFIRAGMGVPCYPLYRSIKDKFSFDPIAWVNEGYTVTYVSLQLAFWMGFTTVLLVGVDHRYACDAKPNKTIHMDGDDPSHFDPAYFRGQDWQAPDLTNSEKYYRVARHVYEKVGRRIVNLGPDSALDVFERGDLTEWL